MIVLCAACVGSVEPACLGPEPADPPQAAVLSTLTERFDAGTLSVIELSDLTVCDGVTAATGDSVVRTQDEAVIQLDRFRYDRVRIFHPPRWHEPVTEFSVGRGANPHDVARCGGAWLISLYEEDALGLFDDEGHRIGEIGLSEHADGDGLPEASGIVGLGDTAWVALERLSRTSTGFFPEGPGRLVEISCDVHRVSGWVEAPPNVQVDVGADGVIRAFGADGRLMRLDPEQAVLQPELTFEKPIAQVAFDADGYGVVITRGARLWHELWCVDPQGEVEPFFATDAFLPTLVPAPDGTIWAAVRRGWASADSAPEGFVVHKEPTTGIWRFEPKTCRLIDDAPIPTALPPFSIDFY
ncbi:MAG: hypothetical protein EA397_13000 [Deltaproteobacteria bacterium]|nr:MAG: hypothetical protein EA397_13000 [Deltaproteobacteria bacterium]